MSDSGKRFMLVAGGRKYPVSLCATSVEDWCDANDWYPDTLLHGGATGADAGAARFAEECDIKSVLVFKAKWKKYNRAAGPIRNEKMAVFLAEQMDNGHQVKALLFPGGVGTESMRKHCKEYGIPILEME